MKNITIFSFLALFILNPIKSFSQGTEVTLDPIQINANILPLMAHLEAKLSEKQSVTVGGGLAYSAYYENINGEENFEAFTTPFITGSVRNYYNRKKVKKDNLRNNSGNYIGIYSGYQFDTVVDAGLITTKTSLDSYFVGPVWGIQRNYASGIHLDVSIGFGYQGGQSNEFFAIEDTVTIIGGFEFGFRFDLGHPK